jgi:hypothetical protein
MRKLRRVIDLKISRDCNSNEKSNPKNFLGSLELGSALWLRRHFYQKKESKGLFPVRLLKNFVSVLLKAYEKILILKFTKTFQ